MNHEISKAGISTTDKFCISDFDKSEKFTHHKKRTVLFSQSHYDLKKQDKTCKCGDLLVFNYRPTEEKSLKLSSGSHCHVRYCPRCEWRKSMKQAAILHQNIIYLDDQYEFVFLTLTQKNCPPEELRSELKRMSEGWHRLQLLKRNKAIKGFFRSMEITKGKDGSTHPHYHAILVVSKSYFNKNYYWSQEKWANEWQRVMRLHYIPIVDVRKVRDKDKTKSIAEVIKYSVKDADIFSDHEWFRIVDEQTAGIRKYASGGVLKIKIVEDPEPDDDDLMDNKAEQLFFNWKNNEYKLK